MSGQIFIHISHSEKREGIPNLGEERGCERKDCPGPHAFEMGFGLAGGGYGAYSFCNVCDQVRGKTCYDDGE